MLKEKNTTFAAVSIYYSTFKNMEIREYRQLILDELLARKNAKGEPVIDEKTAKDLLNELTDEDNGKVSYDAQNKVITLTSEKENGKIQHYQVKEDGSIAFLDEGKEITGELASYYILKKK